MSNPLFDRFGRGQAQNQYAGIMKQFNQFRSMFQGNPKQAVQELMNSGKMSQAQYNQLSQMAEQLSRFIK